MSDEPSVLKWSVEVKVSVVQRARGKEAHCSQTRKRGQSRPPQQLAQRRGASASCPSRHVRPARESAEGVGVHRKGSRSSHWEGMKLACFREGRDRRRRTSHQFQPLWRVRCRSPIPRRSRLETVLVGHERRLKSDVRYGSVQGMVKQARYRKPTFPSAARRRSRCC